MNKKGLELNSLLPAVSILVVIALVLGIGLFVMSEVHRQISTDYSGTENALESNDSTLTSTLANASLTNFYYVPSTMTIINASGGETVTNYTTSQGGVITWGADLVNLANTTLWNATFTFNYDNTDSAEESLTTTLTGLGGLADWIAIIVVVIAAAIILGLVISSFGRKSSI